jgi:hypothetical protein
MSKYSYITAPQGYNRRDASRHVPTKMTPFRCIYPPHIILIIKQLHVFLPIGVSLSIHYYRHCEARSAEAIQTFCVIPAQAGIPYLQRI